VTARDAARIVGVMLLALRDGGWALGRCVGVRGQGSGVRGQGVRGQGHGVRRQASGKGERRKAKGVKVQQTLGLSKSRRRRNSHRMTRFSQMDHLGMLWVICGLSAVRLGVIVFTRDHRGGTLRFRARRRGDFGFVVVSARTSRRVRPGVHGDGATLAT